MGPREQVLAPPPAHGHAERKLVRRRHVGGAGFGGGAASGGNLQAFVVDRHGHDTRPGITKCRHGAVIAGILDPDSIAWTGCRACDETERLLRAGDDYDLLGMALDATRFREVTGDRLPEW